ncbi:hypothetical protein CSC81_05810 [Tenacibaculum discolor]|uniref:DUF6427 family protein n=1 Tax=Tenacibaculum discolor TaxID=361581 RepID=A0A2G1BV89_9FLAO|nr:DUF6427 family protein [Tenacibaculum discolor]MDP2539960.1 DUF6427 family protein [Tenacibaculum discolor]PHN97926.1 hypothetical protein CSC81_05810 [Tenacibaculum discolor]PHN99730.1 hypothetical protein CSC82_32520 [Rhodobacteraceae bacterium 4F10]
MLANFFGKSKPINFIVLFVLFLGYFVLSIFSKELSFNLVKELGWFLVVFSVYNFIIAKNLLTYDNSFAFLFFVILIGFFPDTIQINKTFYANLTILLFLRKVYSLQSSKNILHKLFDGGLWLGISFLIEPYAPLLLILLYLSIFLHQRFTYQTLLTPVIGFFAPVFLYFTYYFWYDNLEKFWLLFDWNFYPDLSFYSHEKYLLPILFIVFFLVASIILKSPKALAVKNKFRKNWILILAHLTITTAILLLVQDGSGSEFLYVFFPVSVILANGIEFFQKKWYANAIIILFLIASFTISTVA